MAEVRGLNMEIRIATVRDAEAIQKIYAPYVLNTSISFEYDAPDTAEMARRIGNTLREYPYLVAVEEGKVIGYAYAGAYKSRRAYMHAAEPSIYVEASRRGKGIGRLLYEELERRLVRQNVFILYACVTTTDREHDAHSTDASIRFHEAVGYKIVGRYDRCGYKFDKWYSVVWMEKVIAERPEKPEAFVPFSFSAADDQKE